MIDPPAGYVDELVAVGRAAGLAAVGVTEARPWGHTRAVLERRRTEGLAGGMAFTYRNPARSSDPSRILRQARSLVVGAFPYGHQDVPALGPGSPPRARVARYATADHYLRLEQALGEIATRLRADGHRAVVVADENSLVDREAAYRAGLGFYGKNANILLPGRGSWFVLGSVVTDAALGPSPAPVADGCGSCRRCLDGCPTGAIVAPGVVDARRCLAWIVQAPGSIPVELRPAIGDRIYGCDDCQEVCPPNRRDDRAAHVGGLDRVEDDPGPWLDPLELLALDDAGLLDRCDRWYVPDRDPAVLRRNLLVVLGNSGAHGDPAVRDAVRRHCGHPDPMVAEHARWADRALDRSAVAALRPAGEDDAP